jgi:hypothetical protein
MRIAIHKLTEAGLIDLNHRVVQQGAVLKAVTEPPQRKIVCRQRHAATLAMKNTRVGRYFRVCFWRSHVVGPAVFDTLEPGNLRARRMLRCIRIRSMS